MFGYFKLDKNCPDVLSNYYKKNYCYLCRSLGHHYGIKSRFLLSYDVTLFLILVTDEDYLSDIKKVSCLNKEVKPYLNQKFSKEIAALNILLTAAKLEDDIKDEKKLSAKILNFIYKNKIKKAKNDFPLMWDIIKNGYNDLRNLESSNQSLEILEESFSKMMINLGTSIFELKKEHLIKSLDFLARWLYFIDAVDDLNDDIKKKTFNPLKTIANSFEDLKNNKYDYLSNHLTYLSKLRPQEKIINNKNDAIVYRMITQGVYESNYHILTKKRK